MADAPTSPQPARTRMVAAVRRLRAKVSLTGRHGRWLAGSLAAAALVSIGCSGFETQQRRWIFQAQAAPASTPEAIAATARDVGMESVWIDHVSAVSGRPIRLHGLWARNRDPGAPLLLYLHGVRRDVARGAYRIEQMRELGFSVLAVDYRGFGNSTDELPSEKGVVEDAQAAWRFLGELRPGRPRFVFGHSLGGAIAVQLAARLADEPASGGLQGLIVEGTFTSVGDMFSTFKWGWLPVGMLITERFDSLAAVPRVTAPMLVVHGSDDSLVPSRFGRSLYERATAPKRFLLIDGGTHFTTSWRGAQQYRAALHEFFGLALGAAQRPGA